ncbi:uncharacterized protein LOC131325969 [Rhododendron vialii]|uniref:uncharacterized protein LOC131325969 n=1 Tax=Rhododendron vialii TaxID=182163 RepID=UPI00265E0692|nr:uncharacterized protein LOC131325969 [Rhododendron vialii]
MSYTNYLLSRLTTGIEDLQELAEQTKLRVLQKCLAEMKTSLDDAKKCYAAEVTLNEEMMLIDGYFILEFLYRSHNGNSKGPNTDPIFGNTLTLYDVKNDLVLLENQIPFFVLEKLFHLTVRRLHNNKNWSLTDYVRWCYGNKMSPIRIPTTVAVVAPKLGTVRPVTVSLGFSATNRKILQQKKKEKKKKKKTVMLITFISSITYMLVTFRLKFKQRRKR